MTGPTLTLSARAAHRRLTAAADTLVEALRHVGPTSAALDFAATSLNELAAEYREQAATAAEHEALDVELFDKLARSTT